MKTLSLRWDAYTAQMRTTQTFLKRWFFIGLKFVNKHLILQLTTANLIQHLDDTPTFLKVFSIFELSESIK